MTCPGWHSWKEAGAVFKLRTSDSKAHTLFCSIRLPPELNSPVPHYRCHETLPSLHHHQKLCIKDPLPIWHCSCFHSNTLPESHGSILCSKKWWCNVLWLWLWKVTVTLLQRMPSQLAAWSLQEPSEKKRRRGERQWVVTQDGGLFSLWTCSWLLLKQNPSQVCTLMVLLLGNKSSNPGEKVKLDCSANSSPEVRGNDYGVKWLHH